MGANETPSHGGLWSFRALYTTWLHVSCLLGTLLMVAYLLAPVRGYYVKMSLAPLSDPAPQGQGRSR